MVRIARLDRPALIRVSGALLLFSLNMHICWRLLFTEYLPYSVSLEPVYFALARAIQRGMQHGWWPEWYCGMPFTYTYQPLLHYIVAGVSSVSGLSIPRSFHAVFAVGYALGPVAVYFLSLRLTRRTDVSLTSGLLYSLWSPSALLIPAMARDITGVWNAKRLHTPVVYADSPHVFGLTLLPVALLLVDRAIERSNAISWILAALASISVLLTSVPAFVSLVMALVVFAVTADRGSRIRTWLGIAAAPLIGYVLTAPFLPVSGLWLAVSNAQWMDPAGKFSNHLAHYALTASLLVLAAAGVAHLQMPRCLRFALVFALLTMTIVLASEWFHFRLMSEAGRFHLVMEMAIVMAISYAIVPIVTRLRGGNIFLAAALVIFCIVQTNNYRRFARDMIRSTDITSRSEYKIARWMDENARGSRVHVPGSVSFWLNALTDTPQMTGCCYQNVLFQGPRIADYLINYDPQPESSIAWLRVLGVRYVAMCGPRSTENYKANAYPKKFDGLLPLRWRDGDDSIYEVPSRSDGSLAHVVLRDDLVHTFKLGDITSFRRYVEVVENPSRPLVKFTWENSTTAQIEGVLQKEQIVSVQMPYHFGWRAVAGGRAAAISRDALGMTAIEPSCDGPCSITLTFNGGFEAIALKILATLGWIVAILAIVWQFRPRTSHATV